MDQPVWFSIQRLTPGGEDDQRRPPGHELAADGCSAIESQSSVACLRRKHSHVQGATLPARGKSAANPLGPHRAIACIASEQASTRRSAACDNGAELREAGLDGQGDTATRSGGQ
jgi:hypothetical protein